MTSIPRTIIVIPVFNGRDSLLRLINEIRELSVEDLVVIDDGSADGLHQKDVQPYVLLKHIENRGKGAALKTGFAYAQKEGFTHALSMDADGQHSPDIIKKFIAMARSFPRHIVVGNRNLTHQSMPFHRQLSNNMTSLMLSLRTGSRILDSQVGYRLYPLGDSRLWDSREDGFQFESAIFLNAARMNIPLSWIEIPVIYTDEKSHMHLVKDTLRFVRTYFRSFQC